ncbi:MAG TPA: FAD-dependent oxidoreductase [Thermomicrobiales bacterium]|nr:FAD-dependent oxidoreductase [Thermomicrobiales bacterium]
MAVIGAGPYGLAAAAHLRAAGVETHVLGEAMTFWEHQMPAGMVLRSSWEASNIADPAGDWSLDQYPAADDFRPLPQIPLTDFVRYGQWFQRQAVPDLDRRRVTRVDTTGRGFRLALDDGDALEARRVVVATGLAAFPWRPPQFGGLSPDLVSHAVEQRDLGRFAGRRVAVVGGGQSALESAALLHEAGAEVEVLTRAPRHYWLGHLNSLRRYESYRRSIGFGLVRRLLHSPGDVGPPGLNWITELPDLFRLFPYATQRQIARRALRPAGAGWLQPRLAGVPLTVGRTVVTARAADGRLHLALDDGSEREVDHALLATGYRVAVAAYPFLPPELVRLVRQRNGHPLLNAGFESAIPGLHFVGAAAAESFGPLMRFVAGTKYAARALARGVVGEPAAQVAPSRPLGGQEPALRLENEGRS